MTRLFLALLLSVGLWCAGDAWAGSKSGTLHGAINLNTATAEQLQQLPGVGPKRAEDIIAYREKRPFTRPSQLSRVKGFGPATMKKLQPYLAVEGETTLSWSAEEKPH